jgi:kynureninase
MTGWMAHRHPFAFEVGPQDYADDIYRFLHGSPNVPGMYAAMAGYEIINEVGVDKIREKSIRQTTRLIEIAEEAGFTVRSPKDSAERGGSVVIDAPHGQAVTKELLRRDCLVDYRPGAGIRVAPHFYTKDEELELIVREIKTILESKAYEAHSAVTA